MKQWFAVRVEGNRIVIEVFPYYPGGATAHIDAETAEWLAALLREAAREVRRYEP